MNACSHQKEKLMLHLYGELDSTARKEVEDHLNGCPGCRQESERLFFLQQLLRKSAGTPELSSQEVKTLVTGVKSKLQQARAEKWWRRYLDLGPARLVPMIATACLVIVTAGIVGYLKYHDSNKMNSFSRQQSQAIMVSDQDLEILRNLELLKEMDAIQKLLRVVDINDKGQPQGDANHRTGGMIPHGYHQAVV